MISFSLTGFKSTTERLGIVFTPVEIVDFIVHSVDDVLKKYFGKSLANEGVECVRSIHRYGHIHCQNSSILETANG